MARDGRSIMSMFEIPELTTDRLLLRGFRPEDFESYAVMMAHADVSRHLMDGRPLTRVEAWRQLAMFAGHWVLRSYGLWGSKNVRPLSARPLRRGLIFL